MAQQRLFQEKLRAEPFWMLAACALVNRATWRAAERVLKSVREKWPTPDALRGARYDDLLAVLRLLGFENGRAAALRVLAAEWIGWSAEAGGKLDREWLVRNVSAAKVCSMRGFGKYAADSWLMFVLDRPLEADPTDAKLREYKNRFSDGTKL